MYSDVFTCKYYYVYTCIDINIYLPVCTSATFGTTKKTTDIDSTNQILQIVNKAVICILCIEL